MESLKALVTRGEPFGIALQIDNDGTISHGMGLPGNQIEPVRRSDLDPMKTGKARLLRFCQPFVGMILQPALEDIGAAGNATINQR